MKKIILLWLVCISILATEELHYEFQGAPERYDGTTLKYVDGDKTYIVSFKNMKVKIQGYNSELDNMENMINLDGDGNSTTENCYVTVHNVKYDIQLTIVIDKISGAKHVEVLKIKQKMKN